MPTITDIPYQHFHEADRKYFKTIVDENGTQTFITDLDNIFSPDYYEARSPDGALLETREYPNGLNGIEIERKYAPDGSYTQTERSRGSILAFSFDVTADNRAKAPTLTIGGAVSWETDDNILTRYVEQALEYINEFKPEQLEKIKQIFHPDQNKGPSV